MTNGETVPMKSMLKVAGLGLALLTAACNQDAVTNNADAMANKAKPAAPAGKDWSKSVVATPEGGFLMGNPNAKVKLLEFGSFTCPHCRDFHTQAAKVLKERYIASGQVAWEFRSFILNGIDVPVSLLAYCVPPAAFFATQDGIYDTQEAWVGSFQKNAGDVNKLQSAPQDQQFAGVIKATGLDGFFKMRGLPASKQQQCLADKAVLEKLAAVRGDAVKTYKLTGTPTFVINGITQENVFDWASLKPKLDAALN